MAEPFKNFLDARLVRAMGKHLHRASPAFGRERFEALALDGLDALELKARCHHLCGALEHTLPRDFGAAAAVMEAALAAPNGDADSPLGARDDGLAGWAVWPLTEYVARHGHGDVPRALQSLHAMTQRFSAEWAVRPFLLRHPDVAWPTLARWTRDPSPHVRRLASEGSRPRLPWGMVLKPLIADPTPTLPLLRALQDDPSEYVRRSVANHLNDIAKDHPALVVAWVREHLPGASPERRALLRHASRTLVKQGDGAMLAAWGLGDAFTGHARLRLAPARLAVGESLQIDLALESTASAPQRLVVDYAVHHVKARGHSTAKVFKGWSLELAGGERRVLARRHSMKAVTTRRYHAGLHRVEIRVNGRPMAEAAFELDVGPA